MRLPKSDKTEVFVMRISKKHKNKLEELAKKGKFGCIQGSNATNVAFFLFDTKLHFLVQNPSFLVVFYNQLFFEVCY